WPGLVKRENVSPFRLLQDYSTCCFLSLLLVQRCTTAHGGPRDALWWCKPASPAAGCVSAFGRENIIFSYFSVD
ncbi:hypothetical protein, partial [Serratia plymuthica]|uniref:hypothetical protein n=1 Tax=Serratia plymuthica TaxID=82996 RepID=UPI001E37EACD